MKIKIYLLYKSYTCFLFAILIIFKRFNQMDPIGMKLNKLSQIYIDLQTAINDFRDVLESCYTMDECIHFDNDNAKNIIINYIQDNFESVEYLKVIILNKNYVDRLLENVESYIFDKKALYKIIGCFDIFRIYNVLESINDKIEFLKATCLPVL